MKINQNRKPKKTFTITKYGGGGEEDIEEVARLTGKQKNGRKRIVRRIGMT